jgi:hypothetical protein
MADRLPIVSIAGEKKELPASDTIAQSKINSLVGDLALKAPLAAPDFTGDVTFDTDVLVVDSVNNRVGVGTASPHKTLTVGSSDATAWLCSGGTNTHLTLSPVGSAGVIILRTGGTNGDPDTTTERMRIVSDGKVGIGNTPAVELDVTGEIRASSGILFGTDTAAANKLDDYEEGTWTPALTNIGTGTYSVQTGAYTKIGRLVTVRLHIDMATVGTGSGALIISLPFAQNSSGDLYGVVSGVHAYSWTTSRSGVNGLVNPDASNVNLYYGAASTAAAAVATHEDLGTGNILLGFSYEAA